MTEEKRALRTYYYDSTGHKCKKSEAVKVVKKGTILQKGTTRYFSDKNEHFKSQKFVYECKDMILRELLNIDWSLRVEQYKNESKINDIDNTFHLIDFLRNKMTDIFKRLKKFVNIQKLLDIEYKDKIDIERDKRNDKLYIIDDDYIKQQNQQELEYEDDYEL